MDDVDVDLCRSAGLDPALVAQSHAAFVDRVGPRAAVVREALRDVRESLEVVFEECRDLATFFGEGSAYQKSQPLYLVSVMDAFLAQVRSVWADMQEKKKSAKLLPTTNTNTNTTTTTTIHTRKRNNIPSSSSPPPSSLGTGTGGGLLLLRAQEATKEDRDGVGNGVGNGDGDGDGDGDGVGKGEGDDDDQQGEGDVALEQNQRQGVMESTPDQSQSQSQSSFPRKSLMADLGQMQARGKWKGSVRRGSR